MNKNFVLSEKLRLFITIGSRYRVLTLGNRLAVSIRRRYSYSQSIYIYPESGYNFFLRSEVMCFISLANGLELDAYVTIENGLPVIEVTDNSIKD